MIHTKVAHGQLWDMQPRDWQAGLGVLIGQVLQPLLSGCVTSGDRILICSYTNLYLRREPESSLYLMTPIFSSNWTTDSWLLLLGIIFQPPSLCFGTWHPDVTEAVTEGLFHIRTYTPHHHPSFLTWACFFWTSPSLLYWDCSWTLSLHDTGPWTRLAHAHVIPISASSQSMRRVSFKAKGWPWSNLCAWHYRKQEGHSGSTGTAITNTPDSPGDFRLHAWSWISPSTRHSISSSTTCNQRHLDFS